MSQLKINYKKNIKQNNRFRRWFYLPKFKNLISLKQSRLKRWSFTKKVNYQQSIQLNKILVGQLVNNEPYTWISLHYSSAKKYKYKF